mmetsp:Transcript_33475/g.101155  ORF Transcript_33475/g.101155 Transcript_33475/m.101155 type:complete len:352 (-) Transcript_33475:956-2011(-)
MRPVRGWAVGNASHLLIRRHGNIMNGHHYIEFLLRNLPPVELALHDTHSRVHRGLLSIRNKNGSRVVMRLCRLSNEVKGLPPRDSLGDCILEESCRLASRCPWGYRLVVEVKQGKGRLGKCAVVRCDELPGRRMLVLKQCFLVGKISRMPLGDRSLLVEKGGDGRVVVLVLEIFVDFLLLLNKHFSGLFVLRLSSRPHFLEEVALKLLEIKSQLHVCILRPCHKALPRRVLLHEDRQAFLCKALRARKPDIPRQVNIQVCLIFELCATPLEALDPFCQPLPLLLGPLLCRFGSELEHGSPAFHTKLLHVLHCLQDHVLTLFPRSCQHLKTFCAPCRTSTFAYLGMQLARFA